MANDRQGDVRRAREKSGRSAEAFAAFALRLRGYRIIDQRVKTPSGEIDLVIRRGGTVAFVEVKLRPSVDEAAGSISPHQRRRIVAAAAHYISSNPSLAGLIQRFDAVLVAPGKWPHHIINAWTESGD